MCFNYSMRRCQVVNHERCSWSWEGKEMIAHSCYRHGAATKIIYYLHSVWFYLPYRAVQLKFISSNSEFHDFKWCSPLRVTPVAGPAVIYRPEEMVLPLRRYPLVIPPIPPELGGGPNMLGWPKLLLGIDGAAWTWGGIPPPHLIPWTWLCCTRGAEWFPKGLDGFCGTGSCGIGFWTRSTKSEPHWWQFHGSRTESLRASQLKIRYSLCLLWFYRSRNCSLT